MFLVTQNNSQFIFDHSDWVSFLAYPNLFETKGFVAVE
jgi:hypothetical protein